MRTINIDDDIYEFIASQTKEIGETASDILRRLLLTKDIQVDSPITTTEHELSDILANPRIRFMSTVDKYLYILGEAYKAKPEKFDTINSFSGRGRKYFASSRTEIESSGNSTQPKQIPGTSYWAMTNSTSDQKSKLLKQVLVAVGFNSKTAQEASLAILQ